MIIDLPSTTTHEVSKKLVRMRNDVGAMALGRVLTLVIVVDDTEAEAAIAAANDASRQHPCRIIAVVTANRRGAARLDAQIRVGGDAGASEVVVLRMYGPLADHGRSVVTPLLLPDSPLVVWWPTKAPKVCHEDAIGSMANRRITDAAESSNPRAELKRRAAAYADGDTDLAWTRITLWRGLLAAALDQAPFEPVTSATVVGGSDSPSTDLLAAWLAMALKCPVTRARGRAGTGMTSVRLERKSGPIDLVRPDGLTATLAQPGQPDRRISLARRGLAECLADELRRLDPDDIFEETLQALPKVLSPGSGKSASEAVADGDAMSPDEARRTARRISRAASGRSSMAMVEAPEPPPTSDETVVKEAAATKLAEKKAEKRGEQPAERPAQAKAGAKTAAKTAAKATRKRGASTAARKDSTRGTRS